MNILVVGSINMDVVNHVDKQPLPGETIKSFMTDYNPGGKGANQAVAASLSGGTVRMAGAVGRDAFSSLLRENLDSKNVNTQYILDKDGSSGMAFITVDKFGENSIIISEGANGKFSKEDITNMPTLFTNQDVVLLQNEIGFETNLYVLEEAYRRGIKVFFNPAPAVAIPQRYYPMIDTFIINETEANEIFGVQIENIPQAIRAAEKIVSLGTKHAIITLGAKGSVSVSHTGDVVETPAFHVEVVDTTAAGDTFIGALAAVMKERSPADALRFASAASALTVTHQGAQISIPARDDICKFLAGF